MNDYPDWLNPSASGLESLIANHYRVIGIRQHTLHSRNTIELPKPQAPMLVNNPKSWAIHEAVTNIDGLTTRYLVSPSVIPEF